MKFTKDEARKELSALMTAKGEKLNLSERSLNEQLDTLIPLLANEETELSDFVNAVLPVFKTADANVRNDVSLGINEYKQKNPVKTKEDTTEGISAYEKRIAELEAKFADAEKRSRAEETRKTIVSKLKDKGVKDEEWVSSLLAEIGMSDDVNVDTKVDSILAIYNKAKATFAKNATPGQANGGNDENKDIKDAIKAASDFVASTSLNS